MSARKEVNEVTQVAKLKALSGRGVLRASQLSAFHWRLWPVDRDGTCDDAKAVDYWPRSDKWREVKGIIKIRSGWREMLNHLGVTE